MKSWPSSTIFTALQLARASDLSQQAIHLRLQKPLPNDKIPVNGKLVSAWPFDVLPAVWQEKITRRAIERKFENGVDYISSIPIEPWTPSVSMVNVPKHHQEKALKLKSALAGALKFKGQPKISAGQVEKMGVEDYKTGSSTFVMGS